MALDTPPVPIAHSTILDEPRAPEAPPGVVPKQPPMADCPRDPGEAPPDRMERGSRAMKVGPIEYADIVERLWPTCPLDVEEASPFLRIYNYVRATNLPNYLGARITIPSAMNCSNWDSALEGYYDSELVNFLRYGWPNGYTAPAPPTPSASNHPSALTFPREIDAFLEKEVRLGAMIGPFKAPPFKEWSQVSPLMTVPKKDSTSRRIIIDLSFPIGFGVNSGISRYYFQGEERHYSLPTINDLAQLVIARGPGCFLWKADLERAYRQLRCDPLDYPLLGVCHRGSYFTDICPSFGCRGSGAAQQRVSEAVCHVMAQRGHPVLAYVDDFCGIHATLEEARAAFSAFHSVCDFLGLKLAADKSAPPATTMEWLGFAFDTQAMVITLPRDKLKEIQDLAADWFSRDRASRKDFQKLAGKLNHVSQCVIPARKFMARILRALRAAPLRGSAPLDEDVRRDVAWFVHYAALCNGRLLLSPHRPVYHIQCDACPSGGGGFSTDHFYSAQYAPGIASMYHISQIEGLNIVVAIKSLLPDHLTAAELVITTDNSAAMHTLNSGKTQDPVLASCSRELWLIAAVKDLVITVNHAPGSTLVLADALSRRHQSQEFDDIATQMTRHLNIFPVDPCDIDCVLTHNL